MWKYDAQLVQPGPISFWTNLSFYLLVLGQALTKLKQFGISFFINYNELTMPCCMENSVDPDQLASSEAS